MAITDELAALAPGVAGPQEQQQQSSWVKDLLDKRYQPQTERLKRKPVGFEFKREPFDPSSYYRALGTFRDISQAATSVTRQRSANKEAAERQREYEANQASIMSSMGGVNPNFTYEQGNWSNGSNNYGLKGVSSNTSSAANYFGSKYGIKDIGGRGPGSVPGSDHPKGRALDFMTSNRNKGNALANDLIRNYKKWNVKYVIWYGFIWHPGRGWKKYNGPSAHTDHVHASFNK